MLFDEIKLGNCPDKFAFNCKNYEIKCHECKGNKTSKYLLYKPINHTITNHPAGIVQKTKVQSYSSKGKAKEKFLVNSLPMINSTRASGIIAGDGDAFIILNNIGKLRIEIKSKFTTGSCIKPTIKEFKEGITQNISIYLIHNNIQKRNYFYIKYTVFIIIFKTFIEKAYKFNFYNLDRTSVEIIPFKHSLTTFFNIKDEFHIDNKKLGNKFYEISSLFILKNKVGIYIAMCESTFYDLIDLYQELTK